MLSQAVDTLIYGVVVWWGLVYLITAMQLVMAKYLFNAIIAIVVPPFIYWARNWQLGKADWITVPATKSTENL